MTRVKVGIRARPLTLNEKVSGDDIIIEVSGNSVLLKNRASGTGDWERQKSSLQRHEEGRHFTYDYCFWSVDSWHPLFASQETIYNAIGVPVVETLLEGYNACVFAYGQSGTGKTYTINGNDSDQGLLPRLCSDLLRKVQQLANATSVIEVSFIELYKERVRDLLNFESFNDNLRVREHPIQGPFVEGLSRHRVVDVNQVTQLIEQSKNHFLPKESLKRSHSIFTIRCLQESNQVVLASELHLVDLAGSERTTLSSDFKDQQDIININKSLVTLGIVISSLANQLGDSLRPNYVPFRNSVLTWLLKETLGGNCVTCMIATVSPASSSYKETLNTLRYAERAGNIRNKPIVNENPNTWRFLMREMKTESELSKQTLSSSLFKQGIILENVVVSPYRSVAYTQSKPTDAFNPFINKDYFEKLVDKAATTSPPELNYFEMNNNHLGLSTLSPLKSNSGCTGGGGAGGHSELIPEQPRAVDDDLNNQRQVTEVQRASIDIKFVRKAISKSCENISVTEVLPLWKRFSRSLQERERVENKKTVRTRQELLKTIEPLPLSVLKMFKSRTDSMEDIAASDAKDTSRTPITNLFEFNLDNMENVRMIEEETDSMLGSWCSSEVESVMSNSGHGADILAHETRDLVAANTLLENAEHNEIIPVSVPVPEDGLNLIRTLVEESNTVPKCPSPTLTRACVIDTRMSESVCSSVDTYNDSLNTPRHNLSEVEDCVVLNVPQPEKPHHQRRRSNYSTDSVEDCNNVTSEESLTYEEVEKSRRTYINYVTNSSTLQFSTVTDERKVPFSLVRDPGTPDSGFVSTKVFPTTPSLWQQSTPRTLREDQLQSSSSSDSITYVFVDQSLSKNSRNNSEERSSAESTGAPEVNSVIEIPKATQSHEDSIVTLDSLEVWKDATNSPRTLSVDSLVMEQYLKMVNDTNPNFERRDSECKENTKSVRRKASSGKVVTQRKESTTTTTSESSESSSRKSSKKYNSDLVKLMSDVVQLLKSNKTTPSDQQPYPQMVCGNCNGGPMVYCPSTSSSTSSNGTSVGSEPGHPNRRSVSKRHRDHKSGSNGNGAEHKSRIGIDSVETLEEGEYRNVMKDSLKKEIRLIRKERDLVYRLLQKEKRKNSNTGVVRTSTTNKSNNGNVKPCKIRLEKDSSTSSSFPEQSSTTTSSRSSATSPSSSLTGSRSAVIKSDFTTYRGELPAGLTPSAFTQQLLESRKEIVRKEKETNSIVKKKSVVLKEDAVASTARHQIKYPHTRSPLFFGQFDDGGESYNGFDRKHQEKRMGSSFEHTDVAADDNTTRPQTINGHSKTTNVSRNLHDSGVVDCCSGHSCHSSFHETDHQRTPGVDKGVQTKRVVDAEQSARPKIRLNSSPNYNAQTAQSALSTWHKPWLTTVTSKCSSRRTWKPHWSSDFSYLDDLLGPDVYLKLPDEFSRSESLDIPLPSRFS